MSFNVDIFNKQIQTSKSDYGTYSVVTTADLLPYATINAVDSEVNTLNTNLDTLSATTALQLSTTNDSLNTRITSLSDAVSNNFLSLSGGRLFGNLTLSGADGQDKSLILFSPTVNASAELKAAITFIGFDPGTGQFVPEPGVSFPRILIREGRLDLDPDTVFTRAEFRVSNVNTQFNIYNKDLAKYYLRIRPNGGFEAGGTNLNATGVDSHAEGSGTTASGQASHAEGTNTLASAAYSHAEGGATTASGVASHAEGASSIASGVISHAAGYYARALQDYTYAWSDGNLGTISFHHSTTRSGQYMVSASGGMFIPGRVGIGTDDNTNALTVVGDISATGVIYGQGTGLDESSLRNFLSTGNITLSSATVLQDLVVYGTLSAVSAEYISLTSYDISTVTSVSTLEVSGTFNALGPILSSGTDLTDIFIQSTSTLETPTTGISAINNIIALSQATYDSLTVKLPTTLYVIV